MLCDNLREVFWRQRRFVFNSKFFSDGIHGHYDGPTLKQSEAYDKLFKVWGAMGKYHRDLLNMIVLGNMGSKQISQRLHLNLNYTMGQVLSTFILLEEAMKDL